ncbi:putative membrane protein [Bacillus wiedmannii]|nr:putative membrane protein [Bacillus wiedmannii]
MTLTLFLLIFIFIAFFSALTIIIVTIKKGEFSNRPYLQSIIVFVLFSIIWILYVTSFYSLLPEKVSKFIFLPIWFSLCMFPLYVRAYRFLARMEKQSCVLNMYRFFSFISFLFGLFLLVLSGM